jgi:toxin YhaV
MQRHGWTLLFHQGAIEQLHALQAAAARAGATEAQESERDANAKLFRALSQCVLDVVPGDPSRDAFRDSTIAAMTNANWRSAKIGGRVRLFVRSDSKARAIVFATVKD